MLVNALHDPSMSVIWAIRLREQEPTAVSIFPRGFGLAIPVIESTVKLKKSRMITYSMVRW